MLIDKINAGALALRAVHGTYSNLPSGMSSPFELSKNAPYFGYVDIDLSGCPTFVMLSNNDDFVVKDFFWNGPNAYEPMSLKLWLALARSSSIVFDIGAYTGLYALAAAKVNPKTKVYAFEALDTVYSRLLLNKSVNDLGNLSLRNVAVSDHDGVAGFKVFSGESILTSGSSLVTRPNDRTVVQTKQVACMTLDALQIDYGLSRLDLIKIDAEGAEHMILSGGAQTLTQYKPDIICEVFEGAQTDDIQRLLSEMGYNFFQIHERDLRIAPVQTLTASSDMSALNVLITMKSDQQIQNILSQQ